MRLILPNESHRNEWEKTIEEWDDSRRRPKIFFQETFDKFLEITQALVNWDDEVRQLAKSSVMLLMKDDDRILWCSWIRHHIQYSADALFNWHIGYGIRPDERGKWYAREVLRLSLIEAKNIGIRRVLVACDDDNLASAKVIEANGGEFESYNFEDGTKRRRYWIEI